MKSIKLRKMKKLVFALAIALTAGLSQASAKDPVNVNRRVAADFQSTFNHAKNVRWSASDKYVVAEFSLNDQVQFAYYHPDGSYIGVIRHILTTDLPADLGKRIKKDYGSYWVSELFRLDTDQETSYYVRLENGEESVMLKSDGNDEWQNYRTTTRSGRAPAAL
jgi:hypothetical protein